MPVQLGVDCMICTDRMQPLESDATAVGAGAPADACTVADATRASDAVDAYDAPNGTLAKSMGITWSTQHLWGYGGKTT